MSHAGQSGASSEAELTLCRNDREKPPGDTVAFFNYVKDCNGEESLVSIPGLSKGNREPTGGSHGAP